MWSSLSVPVGDHLNDLGDLHLDLDLDLHLHLDLDGNHDLSSLRAYRLQPVPGSETRFAPTPFSHLFGCLGVRVRDKR